MSRKLNSNPNHNILLPTSLIYLALPILIFVVGWLKWYFSIPIAGLVLLTFAKMMHGLDQDREPEKNIEKIEDID